LSINNNKFIKLFLFYFNHDDYREALTSLSTTRMAIDDEYELNDLDDNNEIEFNRLY